MLTASKASKMPIRYRIRPHNKHEHLLQVEVFVPATQIVAGKAHELRWPTWIPGSYLIREYARHVVSATACDGDKPLALLKSNKSTWTMVASGESTVRATFVVYAFDRSVRGAFLDADRFYFNGAAVFPEWVGADGPLELDIEDSSARGQVATTMPAFSVDERGFGRYRLPDYDALLDYPVEISEHERVDFEVQGVPHSIVVTNDVRTDLNRIASDTAKICASHIRLFHGDQRPAFAQYLFLLSVLPEGYGGLEHRDSTSLVCAHSDLPIPNDPTISEGYLQLLGLISHEYFHAWNVKRIRPAAFIPYDLRTEASTSQLWIYEGFTSYYDDLGLVRADVITVDDYIRLLGRNLTALQRNPGRNVQSLAQSGADSWIKYYRQDENSPNAGTSYYLKGGLVALLLDLTLRATSQITLDDVMRAHFAAWQSKVADSYPGTDDNTLEQTLERFTQRSWRAWFESYVEGTEPLPLEAALAEVALRVRWRAALGPADRGGRPEKPLVVGTHWLALGLIMTDGERIRTVLTESSAAKAGLASGDHVVAINHRRAQGNSLNDLFARARVGDAWQIHVFRQNKLMEFNLRVPSAKPDTAWCERNDDANPEAVSRRQAWLTLGR
jgi:predicted metalloprotease with PDZ domain